MKNNSSHNEWVRWVLLLPTAILVPFIINVIYDQLIRAIWGAHSNLLTWGGLILESGFVLVGSYIAPKWQSRVAIGLFLLVAVPPFLLTWPHTPIQTFGNLLGAGLVAGFMTIREKRKSMPKSPLPLQSPQTQALKTQKGL